MKQPRLLFWLFIVLNSVPNFCLLFTEPLSGLGKTILILLPLGVYMVVFSLFKRAGLMQLILIPVLILHAFQLVLFYLFGESVIAVDMFLNLPTTNASEAGNCWEIYGPPLSLSASFISLLSCWPLLPYTIK
ncbi:MAG: phosphoethanolamine transferase domain-containing protein [Butyricimonas faecihominis]